MRVRSEWLRIRGHQIYLERFDGESSFLVVLLHHGLGSVQAWQAQIDVLTRQGYSVLAYDRWGYGQSDERTCLDPPYFEEDVRDLETLLAQENRPLVLVGHSDGGNIALMYARRHPEQVIGMIIVAAHIYFEPKMAQGIQELSRAYWENESFRRGLLAVHRGKGVFERWFQAWYDTGVDWDLRPMFSAIPCQVLVVQGSEDEHASLQHARDCAVALPKGRVQIIEAADHMLPQKWSEIFNRLLIETLNEIKKVDPYVQ